MNEPGPVLPMTTPEPTNRPAPITPPMAIILNWRSLRPFLSSGPAPMAFLHYSDTEVGRCSSALDLDSRIVRGCERTHGRDFLRTHRTSEHCRNTGMIKPK